MSATGSAGSEGGGKLQGGDGPPRKVAVFRALQLGDLLCAVPALRALRAALPASEITLIGLPWARAFVSRFARHLDDFLEFPGHPALPEQPARLGEFPAFLQSAQRRGFDLVLQMHGSGSVTNVLTALLGARRHAGFFADGAWPPDPDLFVPWPKSETEVRTLLRLTSHLGAPVCGEELEFPLAPADFAALEAVAEARALEPGRYVCVHPGARAAARRWGPERFAAAANAVAALGLDVVLTGTADEAPLTRAVAGAMRTRPIDLTGRTNLGAVAALLSRSRFVLCNDTGVSHLAAALRVPSLVVFGASDPRRWAPTDRSRHRVIGHSAADADVLSQAAELLSLSK